MNKNKVLKSSVLPLALCLTTMTFSPILVSKAIAEVQNVQQGELVKGTIVDETGEPVIGATVLVVGGSATQGTVTDMDGNFSIKVKPGAKLKVTYIGFDDQVVSAKNGMKVTMKEGGAARCLSMLAIPVLHAIAVAVVVLTLAPIIFGFAKDEG